MVEKRRTRSVTIGHDCMSKTLTVRCKPMRSRGSTTRGNCIRGEALERERPVGSRWSLPIAPGHETIVPVHSLVDR